jgi:dethiobiotin synthetase
MKRNYIGCTVAILACLVGFGPLQSALGQNAGVPGKTVSSQTPPPALQNMKGTPGYQAEYQKWVQSQNSTAETGRQQANKDVERLKNAQLNKAEAVAAPSQQKSPSCYDNYKGITDPAKAKEAWVKDQANSKQQ